VVEFDSLTGGVLCRDLLVVSILNPGEIQIVHACQRCALRAFLCGTDEQTGKSFEHRREWIRQRLEFLASVFGIDCLTYAVMSNHIHLILRSRPDVVAAWSDDDVARRWLRLFPKQRKQNGDPALRVKTRPIVVRFPLRPSASPSAHLISGEWISCSLQPGTQRA
jgi:hypothetical protein